MTLNHRGITLLEILVVMAIIASFFTLALPRLQNQLHLHLKKEARLLAITIQYVYSQAAMKNKMYRIHYDLDNQMYWIESTSKKIKLKSEEDEEEDFKKKEAAAKFKKDKVLLKKPAHLKKGIQFLDIKTESLNSPQTSGHVYTHFFPYGYAEASTIRLKSKEGKIFTIVVNSLTGNAKVYGHDIETQP